MEHVIHVQLYHTCVGITILLHHARITHFCVMHSRYVLHEYHAKQVYVMNVQLCHTCPYDHIGPGKCPHIPHMCR